MVVQSAAAQPTSKNFNRQCQFRTFPYFLFVGADVEQSHGTVGGAAGCRGRFGSRTGLRYGGDTQRLRNGSIAQSGGQVLLHLLSLRLLDVVLGGVFQVGLHLLLKENLGFCP